MLCFTSPTRKRFAAAPSRLKACDDFVLRGVDVLIFVHENEAQFFAPAFGRRRRFVRGKIPEQFQARIVPSRENPERRRRVCGRRIFAANSCASRNNVIMWPRTQFQSSASGSVPFLTVASDGEKFRLFEKCFQAAWRSFPALPLADNWPVTVSGSDLFQELPPRASREISLLAMRR